MRKSCAFAHGAEAVFSERERAGKVGPFHGWVVWPRFCSECFGGIIIINGMERNGTEWKPAAKNDMV